MAGVATSCTFWRMAVGHHYYVSDGPRTRIGHIALTGQVLDAKPMMPLTLRVLDAFVVSLVIAGSGFYAHGDGKIDRIEAPSLTVVPPGEPHTYGTGPGQRWTEWFVVGSGPVWEMLEQTSVLPTRGGPVRPSAAAHHEDLAAVLQAGPKSQAGAERQLWSIAAWLTSALRGGDEGIWTRAEQLLSADLGDKIDLRQVADHVAMSYDLFRHQFAARFGRSPLAYRNERRLEVAATWLRLTTMPNREIAARLGYHDEFHLSRRFREHFGTPPSAYRRDFSEG